VLAIWVFHTRIIDGLAFLQNDWFFDWSAIQYFAGTNVEFTSGGVEALSKNQNSVGTHGSVEVGWSFCTHGSDGPS